MQALLGTTNSFFLWLWRASCQASIVIVLVLAAQWLLRNQLAPRWRHALWLLVVIRLALPGSIESPLSLFNWISPGSASSGAVANPSTAALNSEDQLAQGQSAPALLKRSWRVGLPSIWIAGVVVIPIYLMISTWRLGRNVRRQRPVTDGAVLDLLEDCKQEMEVRTPLTLVETAAVSSPSLFGFIRPRLLLPDGLLRGFSMPELRYVFLHELGHLKRGDIPMNWLATAPLVLHWFNPLVWYAFSRMRVDGELACDALALSHAQEAETQSYGKTVIKLLESFSRPAIAPGLVGILENSNQMKRRITMIAKFKKTNGWPIMTAALFGALALVTLTDAQSGQAAGSGAAGAPLDPQAPPQIISTSPKIGATDVDPNLSEITITFDREMGGGFSWTGGGPEFPPGIEGQKAQWRDKRTCVLPVKLQAAHYYRVGINSKSYQNFRSAEGVAARPSAIYFTTEGAGDELKGRTAKPQIVGLTPRNGARDVDPNLKEIRVTFSVAMGGGFSWTGGGPQFPPNPEGKKPFWTDDHKTCVLPVALQPGTQYRLGLNSPSYKNFQSAGGVPLDPVSYSFKTRD